MRSEYVMMKRGFAMNDKTKYEIMRNRELLKGYQASDVGAEKPDQSHYDFFQIFI